MELKSKCSFVHAFEDCGPVPHSLSPIHRPKTEIGYYRSNFDGRQWWTKYFHVNDTLKTELLIKESKELWENLLNVFPTLSELEKFCVEGNAEKLSEVEYNCYASGKYGNYWMRFILLEKNYNIYCHILSKQSKD